MPKNSKKGTVNFTGRKRILRDSFQINVDWSGEIPVVDRDSFRLVLPSDLPSGSRVLVDANHRMSYQFFDLGKKSDMALPEDLELSEIGHNSVTFLIRVVDPATPGLLSARSAPYRVDPPKERERKPKKGESFSLLQITPRDLNPGVPMRVIFPRINGSSDPINIEVNRRECLELHDSLVENEDAMHALVLPSHLESIAERLASDVVREVFDPSEKASKKSSWQSHWNYLFSTWTGKGLAEIDPREPNEVSDWIEEILSSWCMKFGNPARVISRYLNPGGVRR